MSHYQKTFYFFRVILSKRGKGKLPSTLSCVLFPPKFLAWQGEPTKQKKGNTQLIPTIAKIICKRIQPCKRCTRRCSMISSSFSRRYHPFAKGFPFLLISSTCLTKGKTPYFLLKYAHVYDATIDYHHINGVV